MTTLEDREAKWAGRYAARAGGRDGRPVLRPTPQAKRTPQPMVRKIVYTCAGSIALGPPGPDR